MAQECPSYEVGKIDRERKSRIPVVSAVYINDEDKALCNGTVYGWRFCSYQTNTAIDPPFQVHVSMYRKSDGDRYQLVNGSQYEVTMDEGIASFTCEDRFLEPRRYFSVERGDVVASCWEGGNRIELFTRIFSRTLLASGGQCSQNVIEETSTVPLRSLYLSAYISKYYTVWYL